MFSFARVMRLASLLLFLASITGLSAQTITFDMSAFGIKFGKMVVTRTKENDSTEVYTLNAKGYLKVLWLERSTESKQEVRYCNGVLLSSSFSELEKGKLQRWSRISFDGKRYNLESNKGKQSFAQAPGYSILKMYFNKPANLKQIFFEQDGVYVPIEAKDANTLEVKTPEGNRSVYKFEKGQLQEMEFHISVATVYCRRTG